MAKLTEGELLLRRLYRATLHFLVPLTPEETYQIVGREAMKLFDAQYASIFIKNDRRLERVWDSSDRMFRVKSDKRGYAAHAVNSRMPAVVGIEKLAPLHPNIRDWGIKSVLFIPLFYKKVRMGYIALDSLRDVELSARKKEGIKIFGSLAMLVIRKAQINKELNDSLNTRDLFISLASHELRSPLTTINSYAQVIEKSLSLNKKPSYKWAKVLHSETTRLVHMVNELLQLDTIKSGRLEYSWRYCSLDEVLRRAIVTFKVQHEGRRLIYKNKIGTDAQVMADFDKLLQAVTNILNNAAKFSKRDVRMELVFKQPFYSIYVKDDGVGIPNEDKKKIFEGFYKGGNSTSKGIGLGLFLTKSIIEMHRGNISIESNKGEGTTVEINLPVLK